VPDRPPRPGKHAARHKAPSRFSRVADRITPALHLPLQAGVRRTGGTVVALGAVVLAGAAGNGATDGASTGDAQAAMDRPSAKVSGAVAEARVADASEASRSAVRTAAVQALAEQRDHEAYQPSRSGDRTTASHTARAKSIVPDDPRAIAESMIADYGWDSSEFDCLDQLWVSESNWDVNATNPTSGAYGIPQSLPAGKMASAGSDWRTNPATQIEWGLDYIDSSYGTPCSAWEFKQANNWY
jgi:hypothetical protein